MSERPLASKAKSGLPGVSLETCSHLAAELLRVHPVLLTRSGFNSTHLPERSLECEAEVVLFLKIFFSPLPPPLTPLFFGGTRATPNQLPPEMLVPPGSISL